MDMRIPPLKIKILSESNPLQSRVLVRRLAVPSPFPSPTAAAPNKEKHEERGAASEKESAERARARAELAREARPFASSHGGR